MPARRFGRRVENMIAEIRGVPQDENHSREREPRNAADLMERLLHKYHVGMATPEEAIRNAWTEIVGEANAQYCQPLRIARDGVLWVAVTNPVIRQELSFHKPVVLARVKAIPACAHVSDICLRAG